MIRDIIRDIGRAGDPRGIRARDFLPESKLRATFPRYPRDDRIKIRSRTIIQAQATRVLRAAAQFVYFMRRACKQTSHAERLKPFYGPRFLDGRECRDCGTLKNAIRY